jgi:hypothetical protein
MSPFLHRSLAAAALALALPACARHPRPDDTAPQNEATAPKTTVQVTNQNFYDMNLYVVRFGQRMRLGTATGNGTTSTFTFPSQWVTSGPVRFLAAPIGANAREFTQEIDVRPGDVVSLTITP